MTNLPPEPPGWRFWQASNREGETYVPYRGMRPNRIRVRGKTLLLDTNPASTHFGLYYKKPPRRMPWRRRRKFWDPKRTAKSKRNAQRRQALREVYYLVNVWGVAILVLIALAHIAGALSPHPGSVVPSSGIPGP
jgi:hypothetical protein